MLDQTHGADSERGQEPGNGQKQIQKRMAEHNMSLNYQYHDSRLCIRYHRPRPCDPVSIMLAACCPGGITNESTSSSILPITFSFSSWTLLPFHEKNDDAVHTVKMSIYLVIAMC